MIKVACIGDSITQGFTLLRPGRDSYPRVLQRMLGEDYEVRNFGVLDAAARFDSDTPYVRKKAYRKSLEWNPEIFRRDYRKIAKSQVQGMGYGFKSDCEGNSYKYQQGYAKGYKDGFYDGRDVIRGLMIPADRNAHDDSISWQ